MSKDEEIKEKIWQGFAEGWYSVGEVLDKAYEAGYLQAKKENEEKNKEGD